MTLETISSLVTTIVIVMGAALYLWGSFKTKADQIDNATIERLNNAIKALQLENDQLRKENELLRQSLKNLQSQIDQSKADIARLTDLATNQTAINEVKNLLEQFKFLIPLMQTFQQNDTDILHGLKEIREMIRRLPQKKGE